MRELGGGGLKWGGGRKPEEGVGRRCNHPSNVCMQTGVVKP